MKKNLVLIVLMFGILVGVTTLISSTITCIDTDGGDNPDVKGTATESDGINTNSYTDICDNNDDRVAEYFCPQNNDVVKSKWDSCPNGCSNGACVSNIGSAEASAGSVAVAKTGTRTSSTGTKTTSSSAKRSSTSSGVPKGWEAVEAADGGTCYVKSAMSGRTTGRFLGFMFRD